MQYTIETGSRGSNERIDNGTKRVEASGGQEKGQERNDHENGENGGWGKLKRAHSKMIGPRGGQDKRQDGFLVGQKPRVEPGAK